MQKIITTALTFFAITSMNFSTAMQGRDLDQDQQFRANPDESLLKRPIQIQFVAFIKNLQSDHQDDPEAIQAGDSLLALQRKGLVRQPLEKGEAGPWEWVSFFSFKRGTHKSADLKALRAQLDLTMALEARVRAIQCDESKPILVPLKLVDDQGVISPALWRLNNINLDELKTE